MRLSRILVVAILVCGPCTLQAQEEDFRQRCRNFDVTVDIAESSHDVGIVAKNDPHAAVNVGNNSTASVLTCNVSEKKGAVVDRSPGRDDIDEISPHTCRAISRVVELQTFMEKYPFRGVACVRVNQ